RKRSEGADRGAEPAAFAGGAGALRAFGVAEGRAASQGVRRRQRLGEPEADGPFRYPHDPRPRRPDQDLDRIASPRICAGLRQAVGAAGDTVPFRNLEPAIYILCIGGDKGRSRCESIDLVPPPEERAPRFAKNVETPPAAVNGDAHWIGAARLAVPSSARREM